MNYIIRFKNALNYIEENLTSHIELEEIANKAYFSLYHFHRIFGAIVGDNMKEFIRKRRLTEAGNDLIKSNERIIDIAFKYQFGSQAAFTRSFKKMYGITPMQYRKNGENLVLYQKKKLTDIRLKHLDGGISMEPKIIEKDSFMAVGMKYYGSNKNNETLELWKTFNSRMGEIKNVVNDKIAMGVCEFVENFTDESKFTYFACQEVDSFKNIPQGMQGLTVEKNKYAVFTHKGPVDRLGDTYEYIYGSWLPRSEYQLAESHDFEYYDERFNPGHKDSELDIYIPIK